MNLFPCYVCKNIGVEVPRCNAWKSCKEYKKWLVGCGLKGLAMYIAGIIVERRNQKLRKDK